MNAMIDIGVSFSLVYDMKLIVAITAERMAKLMSIATKPYFSFTMLLGIDTNQSRRVMIMMMPHVVSLSLSFQTSYLVANFSSVVVDGVAIGSVGHSDVLGDRLVA